MSNLEGNTIGLTPTTENITIIKEGGGFMGPDPDAGHADFAYYRALGTGPSDISPQQQERMTKLALMMYRMNPLAHRVVKLMAAFSVGGNVKIEAPNKAIQKVLDEHWNHPLNNWNRNFYQYILELGLYGEQFLLANVTESGTVTWGYIDPLRIKSVRAAKPDLSLPDHIELIQKADDPVAKTKKIINYDANPASPTKGFRTGEVLFARTNNVRGSLRGLSDLYPLIDYFDGLDQFMFALQQRVSHQNNWIWDVTLEGMNETEIRGWLESQQGTPPTPGAIRAHNERVTWDAVAPEFASDDSAAHARLFRNYLLGGAGMADWLLGDMASANRAATESSASVIMKTMEQRQREAKMFLEDVFNFVIDQAMLAGSLPRTRKKDRSFYVTLPKIGLRDFQRITQSLRQGAEGIQKLVDGGLISDERAQDITDQLLSTLDLEGGEQFSSKDKDRPQVIRSQKGGNNRGGKNPFEKREEKPEEVKKDEPVKPIRRN